MDMEGRAAAGGPLAGLDERELPIGRRGIRMNEHVEAAEIDRPRLAGQQDQPSLTDPRHGRVLAAAEPTTRASALRRRA